MSTLSGAARLFTPDKLSNFVLRDDILPSRTDVLLYMLSGSKKMPIKLLIKSLKYGKLLIVALSPCVLLKTPLSNWILSTKAFYAATMMIELKKQKKKKPGLATTSEQELPIKKTRLHS